MLAIMGVLATVTATTAMTGMQQQHRTTETSNLESIANGLTASVRRTRSLPSSGTWVDAVSGELALPPAAIATNGVGNRRLLIVDPAASIAPIGGAAGLPYVQTSVGAAQPASVRMVLVSSVGPDLPNLDSVSFAKLWNAEANVLPTGWPSAWAGQPSDLQLRRLDLGGCFHRVILNNLTATNAATWGLGTTTNRVTLAAGNRREFWVIDTSEISLFDSDATLAVRELVRKDASYVLEDGLWRNRLLAGPPAPAVSCGPFADLVDSFLDAPLKPTASRASRQSVVNAAFQFMHSWSFWSREGNCSPGGEWFTTQKELADSSANLDNAAKFLE